jgi:D-alanyl-D-alanine carboxypeptidase/D-alanyl-D-alanine-endopeptidase (penicillin-binding protein 4)
LGVEHQFETRIGYTGKIDTNGVLNGDIIITGGGDPTFGDDKFANKIGVHTFIYVIKKAGIKKIQGKIICDDSHFENSPICKTWAWDDIGNYFGAGVFGLNYAENVYRLSLQPGLKEGSKVGLLSVHPEFLGLNFENKLTTGPSQSGDQSNIFGAASDSVRVIEGTIPAQEKPFIIKGAMPNPPGWVAKTIAQILFLEGMLQDKSQWELVHDFDKFIQIKSLEKIGSPPLSEIVHYTNLNSINLFAECLFKEMGKTYYKFGTWNNGARAVKKYWSDKGIDTIGLFMDDGSGLSRYDGITAYQLTKMLSIIQKEKYFDVFLNSLPVSGESSAMKGMGKGREMEGKIHCKTGHMDRARAYSGYFKSKSGKWLCFTLMVNNYSLSSKEIHDKIEKLLEAIITVDY